MNKKRYSSLLVLLMGLICSAFVVNGDAQELAESTTRESATKVILASQVKWQKLNPARGDQSPHIHEEMVRGSIGELAVSLEYTLDIQTCSNSELT